MFGHCLKVIYVLSRLYLLVFTEEGKNTTIQNVNESLVYIAANLICLLRIGSDGV